jgi:hypothetical protein
LLIAGNKSEDVKKVFQNSKINDFEDSLQYHAAITNRCQCLVTENVRDFYFSEITVMRPEDFLLDVCGWQVSSFLLSFIGNSTLIHTPC